MSDANAGRGTGGSREESGRRGTGSGRQDAVGARRDPEAKRREAADRQRTGVAAMICAGALIAQQVGSKAARDALYLSHFPVTTLPYMVMGAACFSIGMALVTARAMTARTPAWLVPRALLSSAALTLGEWALFPHLPRPAAVLVFLHVASLGSILVSGFWSVVNESFDPRAARTAVGRIATASALGGLLGGLLAERAAVKLALTGILPLLAVLHVFAGIILFRVRPPRTATPRAAARRAGAAPMLDAGAARRTLGTAPYLRRLGFLVFVVTIGAGLLDYVFKARTAAAVESGASLLRFFAAFHTAVSLGTFLVQTTASRIPMRRLGLTGRVATHPLAVGLGSVGALVVPGVGSAAVARAAQTVLYNSLFRSGYEALFTPIAARDKRAAKAIIDVGCERAGDAASGGLVRGLLLLPAAIALPAILALSAVAAFIGYLLAGRLQMGYVGELERRLESGVFRIDPEEIEDPLMRTMMMRAITSGGLARPEVTTTAAPGAPAAATGALDAAREAATGAQRSQDPRALRIAELRSGDAGRVIPALASGPIDADLAPHAIPLLAWDTIYPQAAGALAAARPEIEPLLVARMLDTQEEFAIRRRIPWILSQSSSRAAIEGLLQGLVDPRFEVRFRCGRALARIHARDASLPIDRHRVFAIVLRETRVDRGVWESQRLLDQTEEADGEPFVTDYLRQRSSRSLEHVFTVLSLALDRKPLQVAYQGLLTDDPMLRGTALEYLESTLPPDIRTSLWPFLEDRRGKRPTARDRDAALDALLSSHHSIEINLAKLREKLRGRD